MTDNVTDRQTDSLHVMPPTVVMHKASVSAQVAFCPDVPVQPPFSLPADETETTESKYHNVQRFKRIKTEVGLTFAAYHEKWFIIIDMKQLSTTSFPEETPTG